MHDVSPELALVDDSLAERERFRLPDPDDCLARPPTAAPVVSPPTLTLMFPAPRQGRLPTVGSEGSPSPSSGESDVIRGRSFSKLELAAPLEAVSAEEPTADLASTAELRPAETSMEVADLVEDAELEAEPLGQAPPEPAPSVPTHMPEWVASDVAPKDHARRKHRAAARRSEPRERTRVGQRRVAAIASWVVLGGFLASPLLAFIPPPTGERPTLPPDVLEPVRNAEDDAGHSLSWEPVANAAGYSVAFVNAGVRSDRWSQTAELQLPVGTESEELVTYEWFVYPAFREGAGYRYGPLAASGDVTMPRLAPNEGS